MKSVSPEHWSHIVGSLRSCPTDLYRAFVSQATPVFVDLDTLARPGQPVQIAVEREWIESFQRDLAPYVEHAIHACVGERYGVRFVSRDSLNGSDASERNHIRNGAATQSWPPASSPERSPQPSSRYGAGLDRALPAGPLHSYEPPAPAHRARPHPSDGHGTPHGGHSPNHLPAETNGWAEPAYSRYPTPPVTPVSSGSGVYSPPGGLPQEAQGYANPSSRTFSDTHSLPLNTCNTFDQFIVGPSNRIAHAAAMAVSEHPGSAYNPLFLHGSVGLGKTHLLQAIALRLQQQRHGVRLLYISCETFISQYVKAMALGEVERFQRQFRDLDCLIIDDIHFLGGNKSATQEEFFHTFNALHSGRKQIVISSDSPPGEIPQLQDRLVSRFKSGLQAKIEPPVFETRLGILRHKAEQMQLALDDETLTFLAERFTNNVREMEGAIKTISAVGEQVDGQLSLKDVRRHLADLLEDRNSAPIKRVTPDEIAAEVCKYHRVMLVDLQSASRQKHITLPRQVCMYLIKKLTMKTYVEIGEFFGGRDHSTVIHSVTKIEKMVDDNDDFRAQMSQLERKLQTL